MSTTVNTAVMIAELSRRVPIGFSANVALDSLNGAFRWINQQGSFPWMLKKTNINFTAGDATFTLPTDFDPGKAAVLYGVEAGPVPTEIPYKPWGEAVKHQMHQGVSQTGVISCWSYYATRTQNASPPYNYIVGFTGQAFPGGAVKADVLPFVYHAISYPFVLSNVGTYFPTPDHFDYFIIELAEAEMMRQYRLAGWEVLYKRTTDQLRNMLQAYTTTKITLPPTSEVVNNAQTGQALRA